METAYAATSTLGAARRCRKRGTERPEILASLPAHHTLWFPGAKAVLLRPRVRANGLRWGSDRRPSTAQWPPTELESAGPQGWEQLLGFPTRSFFRKGGGTRDQIANIRWIMEKAREFQKNIYFCFIDYAKAFDCGSQ